MSIVRFLRFPEIAKSPLGVEDVSLDVAKQAAYQFAYVSAMYCAQELLLPAIPYPLPAWLGARTLLCISFGAVALRGMFRRKAVPKEAAKPAEGDPPPQEDEPATAEELDQICKVGAEGGKGRVRRGDERHLEAHIVGCARGGSCRTTKEANADGSKPTVLSHAIFVFRLLARK